MGTKQVRSLGDLYRLGRLAGIIYWPKGGSILLALIELDKPLHSLPMDLTVSEALVNSKFVATQPIKRASVRVGNLVPSLLSPLVVLGDIDGRRLYWSHVRTSDFVCETDVVWADSPVAESIHP